MIAFASLDALRRDAESVFANLHSSKQRITGLSIGELEQLCRSQGGRTGVYCIFVNDDPIYIGKTKRASKRFRDHFVKTALNPEAQPGALAKLNRRDRVEVAFVEVPATIYSAVEETLMGLLKGKWHRRHG